MRRFWLWLLGFGLMLSACDSTYSPPVDVTPIAAPIATLSPNGHSILVPPTPVYQSSVPTTVSGDAMLMRISNKSGWNVCYVYIVDPNDATWGSDWLDKGMVIEDGDTQNIPVPAGTYDMRAENCDYIPLDEEYNVKMENFYVWAVKSPVILFEDYFNGATALTAKVLTSIGSASENVYHLRATQKGDFALASAGEDLEDLAATVETTPVLPADTSQLAYGLMCRLQSNGDGYAFLIRGDGYGTIQMISGGKSSPLVDWTATDQINSGSELNIVEASCSAEKLNLRINGLTVLKSTDATFTHGDVGLVVQPLGESQAEAEFDNLVVRKP